MKYCRRKADGPRCYNQLTVWYCTDESHGCNDRDFLGDSRDAEIAALRSALEIIQAFCGDIDPQRGMRNILQVCKNALDKEVRG